MCQSDTRNIEKEEKTASATQEEHGFVKTSRVSESQVDIRIISNAGCEIKSDKMRQQFQPVKAVISVERSDEAPLMKWLLRHAVSRQRIGKGSLRWGTAPAQPGAERQGETGPQGPRGQGEAGTQTSGSGATGSARDRTRPPQAVRGKPQGRYSARVRAGGRLPLPALHRSAAACHLPADCNSLET